MEQNKEINQFDIPLAKRTYLNNSNSILKKKLLIFSPFIFLLFSIAALQLTRKIKLESPVNLNVKIEKRKKRNGEIINNFFNNIELELFTWVLLARGISN